MFEIRVTYRAKPQKCYTFESYGHWSIEYCSKQPNIRWTSPSENTDGEAADNNSPMLHTPLSNSVGAKEPSKATLKKELPQTCSPNIHSTAMTHTPPMGHPQLSRPADPVIGNAQEVAQSASFQVWCHPNLPSS